MVQIARPMDAHAPAVVAKAQEASLEAELARIRGVLCQQGLQQFPQRPAPLREMRRVLKGGGRLVASVWSRIEGSPGMAALVEALERHVGREAAANRRAPFVLGEADEPRGRREGAGVRNVQRRTRAEP